MAASTKWWFMRKLQRLKLLQARVAPFGSHPESSGSLFAELLQAICSQQLSLKAAATIHRRVCELFPGECPTPAHVAQLSDRELRAAGLSQPKVRALRDLAEKALSGVVPSDAEARRTTDEELIQRLTQVRGIGKWTVEMVLIFRYKRPDVWPVDDLAVQRGFRLLFPEIEFRTARELARCADFYRGRRSELAWYCWRAVEEQKLQTLRQVPFEYAGQKMQLWLRGERLLRIDFDRSEAAPTPLWPGEVVRAPQLSARWKTKITRALLQGPQGLDLELGGTPFQQQVWAAIAAIPYGETRSYLELAEAIGNRKSVRAVAQACGANQLPLVIPCHRVVATSGTGGFSGGVELKLKLLAAEKKTRRGA